MASPRSHKKSAAKSRPGKSAKPAARPVKKAAPARAVAKPARAAKPAPKVIAKPVGKPALKPAARVVGKPAVKGPVKPAIAAKGGKQLVVGAKGAKGAPVGKGGKVVKPEPPKPSGRVRLASPGSPALRSSSSANRKGAGKHPEEVRPLGVLPPTSVARTTHRPPAKVAPARIATPAPTRPVITSPEGAPRVTEKDLKEFEDRLLLERRRILKEMGHLETTVLKVNQRDSSGDLSGYSFHMADAGTDAMEREKAFLFASAEGRVLLEIDDALRRLYRGQYGVCESCGNPIARPRLEVMPQARLCVSCKEKEEKEQRGAV